LTGVALHPEATTSCCFLSARLSIQRDIRYTNWASNYCADFRKCGLALPGAYLSQITIKDELIKDCYSKDGWAKLVSLKKKCDPAGTWKSAVPHIDTDYMF
jgi:hypothetical protein